MKENKGKKEGKNKKDRRNERNNLTITPSKGKNLY